MNVLKNYVSESNKSAPVSFAVKIGKPGDASLMTAVDRTRDPRPRCWSLSCESMHPVAAFLD